MFSHRRFIGPGITFARRGTVKVISPFLTDIVMQINAFHLDVANYLRPWRKARERLDKRYQTRRAPPVSSILWPCIRDQTSIQKAAHAIGFRDGQDRAGDNVYRQFEEYPGIGGRRPRRQRFYLDLLEGALSLCWTSDADGASSWTCSPRSWSPTQEELTRMRAWLPTAGRRDTKWSSPTRTSSSRPNPTRHWGMVFSAQLIEHFEYDELQRFMRVARDKLVPGGSSSPRRSTRIRSSRSVVLARPNSPRADLPGGGDALLPAARLLPGDRPVPGGSGELERDRAECGDYALVATK